MATDSAESAAADGQTQGRRATLPNPVSAATEPGATDTGAARSGFAGASLARLVRRQARANARGRRGTGLP
jgi:hypothetical protein